MDNKDIETLKRYDFRKAEDTIDDFEIYLKIKSDPDAIKYSGFKTAPDREKFLNHYHKILSSPEQHLLYLQDHLNGDVVCATFHYLDLNEETVEGLGYNVFPEYRGHGLGWVMMQKVNEYTKSLGFKYRLSKVAESNIPSIKNLEKSGAYPTGEFEMRYLEAMGREEKYLIYIKNL